MTLSRALGTSAEQAAAKAVRCNAVATKLVATSNVERERRTGVHVLGGQVDQLARRLAVELDEHLHQGGGGEREAMS